jgi:RNA polymerase sigma-70 factor (ECF subfamily)
VWLAEWPLSGEWRWTHLPARANGQPAVASYTWDEEKAVYRAFSLNVLTLRGKAIGDVTSFIVRTEPAPDRLHLARWPEEPADSRRLEAFFERFGLPAELPG